MLDQLQLARPLERLAGKPLLVQNQEVGVLDAAHDLIDVERVKRRLPS